jgi:predicted HicB family RNase H-like nuclease
MNDIIKYKDYSAVLHFSSDDEVFYGKTIGINDPVTFEGQSVSELKKAFKEAIEDYLLTCKELNKTPEKTYKGSFNVRASTNLHREAAYAALQKNVTMNDFIKGAITYAVKHLDIVGGEMAAS